MKPRARKKLTLALSAIPAAFLFAVGAQIGGPHSRWGVICLLAILVVLVYGLVFAAQFMVAFANEAKEKPNQPPEPTR